MEEINSAAMLATKRLAGVTPEVNLGEPITHALPPSANKAAHCGSETKRRHHQKSETWVSVAPQKGLKSSKNFKKACMFADESVPSPGVEGSAAPHVQVRAWDPGHPGGLRRAGRRTVQTPVPVRAMELLVSTQGQHTEKRSVAF